MRGCGSSPCANLILPGVAPGQCVEGTKECRRKLGGTNITAFKYQCVAKVDPSCPPGQEICVWELVANSGHIVGTIDCEER